MNSVEFDVIIVGAGPAGIIAAMQLAKQNLKICLLEKETFPRDKTCGDALSVDVENQFEMIDVGLAKRFKQLAKKTPSYGVKIVAPNQQFIDIPFVHKGEEKCGYICKRIDFDNFLFQELKQFDNITIVENCKVVNIDVSDKFVLVTTMLLHKDSQSNTKTHKENNHQEAVGDKGINNLTKPVSNKYKAKIILGADGAQSIVDKSLSNNKIDLNHYSAGLRMYYENVTNFHQDNFIELHFFKNILPGYLWIFPLPNNEANIGIGMLSSQVSKKKVNLKKILAELLKNHPNLKDRFVNATALEKVKGFGLPLGSKKRKISGNRFLLLGDAAGLIDPFSGEGIANAIRSGRVAAMHLETCFKTNDFSVNNNKAYDKEIYNRMSKEFKISRILQNLCKYPKLFNFVVNKANKNKTLHRFLTETLEDVDKKKMLTKPSFYYRLFFR